MMRSLTLSVAAAQQFFQPVAPSTAFLQPGLQASPALVQAPVVEVVRVPTVSTESPTSVSMLALAGVVGGVVGFVAAAKSSGSTGRRAGRGVRMQEDKLLVDALNKPNWNDPREGNPFEDEGPRKAVEAYQPRGISDATVPKKQYIETEDEPWNSDARQTVTITKAQVEASYGASLPFVAAEADLQTKLSKVEKKDEVKKLMAAALSAGARPGSAVMKDGEKLLKAFEEKGDEAALKARPKAPKAAGAQGGGWDGMKRGLAKTHDNSVA